jgi:hypothetical protein
MLQTASLPTSQANVSSSNDLSLITNSENCSELFCDVDESQPHFCPSVIDWGPSDLPLPSISKYRSVPITSILNRVLHATIEDEIENGVVSTYPMKSEDSSIPVFQKPFHSVLPLTLVFFSVASNN